MHLWNATDINSWKLIGLVNPNAMFQHSENFRPPATQTFSEGFSSWLGVNSLRLLEIVLGVAVTPSSLKSPASLSTSIIDTDSKSLLPNSEFMMRLITQNSVLLCDNYNFSIKGKNPKN